ncbi:MAG: tripartite tricarboxylate transporter substrate binding protein [Proteobacteria bacterium]|nr:tripartite tricarboxylate transporter substrate binding protein [Burkholderiales bacterium]
MHPSLSLPLSPLAVSAFALACVVTPSRAQDYPVRPVRLIVTFTPGGGADTTARVFGERLADLWKQSVLIDNRVGAGGSIGAELVHRAPPDGYTLLLATNTHIINQVVYSSLPFDFVRDFTPIAVVTAGPMVIAVNPAKLGVQTMRDFTAMLFKSPGKFSYASCNVASPHHFGMEMYKYAMKIDALHIPHRGCAPAVADAVAGQVDIVVATLPPAMPFFAQGRLRPIAVLSAQRSPSAPDIPTVRESGIPELKDFSLESYYGFMAPPKTPAPRAARIEADVLKIAAVPELRTKLSGAGMDMMVVNAQAMTTLLRTDYEKYLKAGKAANIKPE